MDGGDGDTIFYFGVCHFAADWPKSLPSTWTQVSEGKPLRVVCHLKPTATRPVTWKHLNESFHSWLGDDAGPKTVGEWDVRRRIIKHDSPRGHAADSASACLSPGSMVTLWGPELADKINEFARWPVRGLGSAFCHIVLMPMFNPPPLCELSPPFLRCSWTGRRGQRRRLIFRAWTLSDMTLRPIKNFNYVFNDLDRVRGKSIDATVYPPAPHPPSTQSIQVTSLPPVIILDLTKDYWAPSSCWQKKMPIKVRRLYLSPPW